MKLKITITTAFILLIYASTFGQKILELEYTCLKDYKNYYGTFSKTEIRSDTILVETKTYGPCKVEFDIEPIFLQSSNTVGFTFYDTLNTYTSGEVECACMYDFSFKVVGLKLDKKPKGWVISNKTMPSEVWEKWFWENYD